MAYAYSAGVGVLAVPDGAVQISWPASTTAVVTTPSTPRTDVIYVDGQGLVRVAPEGQVNESAVIVIRKMRMPAGATATGQASPVGDRIFAMPYGANLGWLAMYIEPYYQAQPVNKNDHDWVELRFAVPTDRACQLRMHQCIYGTHDPGAAYTDFAGHSVGSMEYTMYVDNVIYRRWEIGYSRIWEAREHPIDFDVNEGAHTVRIRRRWAWGDPEPLHFGDPANIWQPGSAGIHDEGVRR